MFVSGSVAARRLWLLASYRADLDAAADALEFHDSVDPAISVADDYRPHLLQSAAVSYWRCYSPSDARKSLDSILPIEASDLPTHQLLRDYRHKSVAHSSTAMQDGVVMAPLKRTNEVITVGAAWVATSNISPPSNVIAEFRTLITNALRDVEGLIDPLYEIVNRENAARDLAELWTHSIPTSTEINSGWPDWDPNRRRVHRSTEPSPESGPTMDWPTS